MQNGISSYSKAVTSSGVMLIASCVGIAVSMLPHMIITSHFGLGRITDGYLMGAIVIQAVTKVLRVGTLGKVYISVLARCRERDSIEHVMSNLANINIIILGCVVCFVYLFAPYLAFAIAPGFNDSTLEVTILSVRILSPTILFMGLLELLTARLHLEKKFSFSAIVNLITPVMTLIFVVTTISNLGIRSALLGNLFGSMAALLLTYSVLHYQRIRYRIVLNIYEPEIKNVARMMTPFYGFSILTYLMGLLPTMLSSALPAGGASALLYARRIRGQVLLRPLEIIPTIIYPSLAKSLAAENQDNVRDLIAKGVKFSSFAMIPLLVGLAVLSQDIIRVVFQRGEFTESATSDVASVFAILMIGLLTGPTSIVYSRALYAAQKTMWINVVKVLTGLWGMLLSIALFRSFQLTGLAVAAASMTTVELIIIYCQLRRIVPIWATWFNMSMLKISLSSLVMGVSCLLFNQYLSQYGIGYELMDQLLRLSIVSSFGFILYIILVLWLRLDEFSVVCSSIRERFLSTKK